MKRLKQELSPFKDDDTKDPEYVRAMWEQYTKHSAIQEASRPGEIKRNDEKVHAYLKSIESGVDHPDA